MQVEILRSSRPYRSVLSDQIRGPCVPAVLRPKCPKKKYQCPTTKSLAKRPLSSHSTLSRYRTHLNPVIFEITSMEGSRSDKRSPQHDVSYRGVRRRSWGRYVSEIRIPGTKTRIWLGSFVSAEMAARAYDAAAFFLRGNSATLNFPELASCLPRPDSASRRDIQRAAAKAAAKENFARHVSDRAEAETDSVCMSGAFWEPDEDVLSFFEDAKEAPLHSPHRFEPKDGFLTPFDIGNYDSAIGNDNVGLDAWWDDGGCNALMTWNCFL